ncbi:MAG: anthranilate synthase component 2 [Flavobacteriales bacterium]|jgi:anthranilate synthase component 2
MPNIFYFWPKLKVLKVVIIDNYDSFTFNLVHYAEQFAEVLVMRNNEIDFKQILSDDKIILSPGPGLPVESGQLMELISKLAHSHSILGVCLGHQALAEHYGGRLFNMEQVLHGTSTTCTVVNKDKIFGRMPKHFKIGHYHSWCVDPSSLGNKLEVTAINDQGYVMGLRHKELPLWGVQFHPESLMTEGGLKIIQSFVEDL